MEFYTLDNILAQCPDCQYYMIIGGRSHGKTYASLKYALSNYVKTGERAALIRRYYEDFKGNRSRFLFRALVENGEISLNHIYESESAVEYVEIRSVEIENAPHSQNNKITLIIRSKENKTANIRCKSYQSSDNLGSTESKEIELIEGGETSVDFVFAGFYNTPYFLSITIDNTRIDFEIDPR